MGVSVCRKSSIVIKKWGLGHSPKQGEGGSPTLSLGTDAGRVCPRALHDAKPTKHTQPFTEERGLGIGIEDKHFFEKTYFYYKLHRADFRLLCDAILIYSFFFLPYTLQELLRRQQPLPQSRRQVTMHLFRGFSFRILRELFQTHKLYTHNGLYPALWR